MIQVSISTESRCRCRWKKVYTCQNFQASSAQWRKTTARRGRACTACLSICVKSRASQGKSRRKGVVKKVRISRSGSWACMIQCLGLVWSCLLSASLRVCRNTVYRLPARPFPRRLSDTGGRWRSTAFFLSCQCRFQRGRLGRYRHGRPRHPSGRYRQVQRPRYTVRDGVECDAECERHGDAECGDAEYEWDLYYKSLFLLKMHCGRTAGSSGQTMEAGPPAPNGHLTSDW